jgi:hypothetical protein
MQLQLYHLHNRITGLEAKCKNSNSLSINTRYVTLHVATLTPGRKRPRRLPVVLQRLSAMLGTDVQCLLGARLWVSPRLLRLIWGEILCTSGGIQGDLDGSLEGL